MYKICVKGIAVLAVLLLISLISISSAAGPRAMPNLYTGQCGVELSVPAPGILSNDVKTTAPLQVLDPETISIDPKYGSIEVQADGSFVYDAPQNLPSGTYVYFYYKATDGKSVTNQAIVKIAVSCKCHGVAPDITVTAVQGTAITPAFLISEGAGCMGCRDVTPKFDLSEIPAQPVAGECYPYTVSCPGCQVVTGQVCFEFVEPPDFPPTITSGPQLTGFCAGGWGFYAIWVKDDFGVDSVKLNGADLAVWTGDNKEGSWYGWIDGTDKVDGDCMDLVCDITDTAGNTVTTTTKHVCWTSPNAGCIDKPYSPV
jgi:hypothetical protein